MPRVGQIAGEVDRSLLADLALHDIPDLPADEWSGHPDGRKPSEFPRPSLNGYDQPSMSRPLQHGLAREHCCDLTFDGSSKAIEVKCVRKLSGGRGLTCANTNVPPTYLLGGVPWGVRIR